MSGLQRKLSITRGRTEASWKRYPNLGIHCLLVWGFIIPIALLSPDCVPRETGASDIWHCHAPLMELSSNACICPTYTF